MVVAAVLCLCLAALIGGSGLWTLTRRPAADLTGQVVRLVAPTQVAAAIMLAAGAVVGLLAPARVATLALILGVAGAVATIGAGSWQGARYAARREARAGSQGCESGGGCGACTRSCQ